MAVSVEKRFPIQLRRREILRVDFEKFTEQKNLAGQGLRTFVVGKQIEELVAEDGDATGLEADDGNAGFDFGGERVENLQQERLGAVEHAVVVEGAAAAEIGFRNDYLEPGGFEDFDCGFGGSGLEMVIEGVRPKEDGRGSP